MATSVLFLLHETSAGLGPGVSPILWRPSAMLMLYAL